MKVMAISLLVICLSILLIPSVYAIRINEVEANPAGTDAGNEWAEFYNDGELSLDGYMIMNNDGENISLNGSFEGYFVYTFAKQWLDNSNETIYLYKDLVLIDKTDLFADSKNNDLTWQFCEGDWKFLNSTKERKNNCPAGEETSEDNKDKEENAANSSSEAEQNKTAAPKESSADFVPSQVAEKTGESSPVNEKIVLSSKTTSSEGRFITKDEKIRLAAVYSFSLLAIILIILISVRKI